MVKNDRVVALRYSKQFNMSTGKLVAYFHDNLRLSRLSHSGYYTMYFVTPSGRIINQNVYLPQGERVFIAPNGKPVIAVRCGNPITRSLPVVKPKTIEKSVVQRILPSSTCGQTDAMQPDLSPESMEIAPLPSANAAIEPMTPEPVVMAVAPVQSSLSFLAVPTALAGSLTGLVPLLVRHSPPVPEPSSLLMLAIGGASIAFRSRRRNTSPK